MELRLFIIACIMYSFMWITQLCRKKRWFVFSLVFGIWNGLFLFFILSCAAYLVFFVLKGGAVEPLKIYPFWVAEGVVLLVSYFGYSYGFQVENKEKRPIIKKNLDWCNTVYFAGFVASAVMFCLIQAFKIPSASMRDTLQEGDHLFVNKAAYGLPIPFTHKRLGKRNVKREDVIVFRFPSENPNQYNCGNTSQYGKDFVKRVIGLPGEIIEIRKGHPFINGVALPQQPYEKYDDLITRADSVIVDDKKLYQNIWQKRELERYLNEEVRDNFGPVIIPEDSYFVMGDNRDNSCDSRFWGPVPMKYIKGKAWFIHWPLKKIGFIK